MNRLIQPPCALVALALTMGAFLTGCGDPSRQPTLKAPPTTVAAPTAQAPQTAPVMPASTASDVAPPKSLLEACMDGGLNLADYADLLRKRGRRVVWEKAAEDEFIMRVSGEDQLSKSKFSLAMSLRRDGSAYPKCGANNTGQVTITRAILDGRELSQDEIEALQTSMTRDNVDRYMKSLNRWPWQNTQSSDEAESGQASSSNSQ